MKLKVFDNSLKILLILCIFLLNVFPINFVYALTNEEKKSDSSTVDGYKVILDNDLGTYYDDSIWTDKSVFVDENVMLDDKFNIENSDDFLTVFSALASSKVIKTYKVLDVMFILDISTSMGGSSVQPYDFENSYIKKTITALNNAVNTLLSTNPKTRIGLTVYGSNAVLLVPLDNYAVSEDKPFLQVSFLESFGINAYFTLEANLKKVRTGTNLNVYATNSGPSQTSYYGWSAGQDNYRGSSGVLQGNGTKDSPWQVGRLTNHQAALAVGLDELATIEKTTTVNQLGETVSNIPVTIHITDGQSTDISAINEKSNWYNVDPSTDFVYTTKVNGKYNANQLTNKAAIPMIFQTLMTASYYTSKVNKHYQQNALDSKIYNTSSLKVTNYSVYASDVQSFDTMPDGVDKTIIKNVCDPSNNFIESNPDEFITGTNYGEGAYLLFNRWKNGEDIKNKYLNDKYPNGVTVALDVSQKQIVNNKDGVTVDDIIKNVYYVEKGNFLSTGFDQLNDKIQEIVSIQNAADVVNPISDEENFLHIKDSLSYVDPLGQYLELKDFKKMLLFGEEYNIIKDGDLKNEDNVLRQYYKAVGPDNEDLIISNMAYESLTFKLSDIKIYNEIQNGNQTLHINISKFALPLKLDKLEVDINNNVTRYESNVDSSPILPIRFVYSVGMKDEVLVDNKIDLNKISDEYKQNNATEKELYFYSNYYSKIKNSYDDNTIGNAFVTFVPHLQNNYYFLQKNYPIYKESSNGEGILKESGGDVVLSNQIKDFSEINKNDTYYLVYDYYVPVKNDEKTVGKMIHYAVAVKGKDFYDTKGQLLLTYFDTVLTEEVSAKGDNTIVTTKHGVRLIDQMLEYSQTKSNNETNTAKYLNAYNSTEDGIGVISFLGNNGIIVVNGDFSEYLIKNPDTGIKIFLILFIILETVALFLFYRNKKIKNEDINLKANP